MDGVFVVSFFLWREGALSIVELSLSTTNIFTKKRKISRVFYSSDFSVVNFFGIALVFVTGHRYWL